MEEIPGSDPFAEVQPEEDGVLKAIEDTLAGLQGEIGEKVDGCVAVMRTLEHEAEAIRTEEVRMAIRRRHLEAKAKRLKDYVKDSMVQGAVSTVESSLFRVTLYDAPPSLVVDDEKLVPPGYFIMRPDLQTAAVKLALKGGLEVPGAHLERGKKALRIS